MWPTNTRNASSTTFFIGGQWVRAIGSKSKTRVSPADCKTLADVPIATADEIDLAIASAANAFEHGPWPRTDPSERAALMTTFAEALERRMPYFARLWATQVGAPVARAVGWHRSL
ncbi:aldehyde dehydrogenase family protein [Sinorhizobium medicae]|nr:aldehyde dehydrogenase family protein [Sinorhizobium medicae]RVJ83463.1 aldehyde dehydrogenase family protein [Sinorhizobium medicae]